MLNLRRREFITLLGGAAAWPLAASGQQSVPVIGLLHSASREAFAPFLAAFGVAAGDLAEFAILIGGRLVDSADAKVQNRAFHR
ncbi:MAG TPA: hypothetical protein VKF35_24120 [Hyphomicrobiaceae bacterium]|nr:hypothetical protein [Hyphomicrobiaceae bacterium]